ncbi:hemerythrin HHE cation-binding protein [Thioalkalivibrio denitrificans]|uniref:Hemerythrin HHE cation-binding protein n=1 Tax=Thioalkalivibrio denitrificans TaxID=108003 RepID=A0A1V3NSY8_9GAMM|nr:hemerythrin domain-containing protein [Thioalkalivibrio denitrificans]OOG28073.1 hemerythrin HHE cation-binding protein [Thioalkalivibrio denitrificans]
MTTFSQYLGDDHGRCDELFAAAELAADARDSGTADAHARFVEAMEHHLRMEEEILFPAFEEASGSRMGPTAVMRHEHEQMRQLFEDMSGALAEDRFDDYLGMAETLLILMQQHNAKEEQMLYPMTDRMLAGSRQALLARMQDA